MLYQSKSERAYFLFKRKDDFMEKIKLKNIEYSVKDILQNDDKLNFTVCDVEDFKVFRNTLTKNNLAIIEVYTEGGVLSTIFEGYNKITGKFDISENEDSAMDVTVYLEKPDLLTQKIEELEAEIAELKSRGL